MSSGYEGKILFVDLTASAITEEILDDHLSFSKEYETLQEDIIKATKIFKIGKN